MARRSRPVKRARQERPGANWTVIGGVFAVGLLGLFGLLFLSLNEPAVQSLADYCADYPDRCVSLGATDAPVTVVEVSDYGCPACGLFNRDTAGLIEERYIASGQVRWLILPYARPGVKSQTGPAAEAALCANEQDRFLPYHQALFALQDTPQALSRQGYLEAAAALEMDVAAFTDCLDSGQFGPTIDANIAAASAADVRATPTFFIDGAKLEGAHPFVVFQQRFDALLQG